MSRLVDLVLRHRLLVVLLWVVVAGSGAATASRTVGNLSYDFGLPGQPAYEANLAIQRTYGGGGLDDPLVLSVGTSRGDLRSGSGLAAFDRAARRVAQAAPGTRLVTAGDDPRVLVSRDGRRAVALLYPRVVPGAAPYGAATPALVRATGTTRVLGSPARLTGVPLLEEGGGGAGRGILVEVVFGAVGALVVLVLVFGSLLARSPSWSPPSRSCRPSWRCSASPSSRRCRSWCSSWSR